MVSRCDGHVTGSRDEHGECADVLLEGVAGRQQVGLRYELVVQSATATYDGRCVLETDTDEQDAFFVQVLQGISAILILFIVVNSSCIM